MVSECFVDELIRSLTKKESVSVRAHLARIGTKEGRLLQELYDAVRYARTGVQEGLLQRLTSPELKNYLSYYRGRLREQILGLLANNQRDDDMERIQHLTDELRKCWAMHAKGFKDVAIRRLKELANVEELRSYPYLKMMLLEEQHRMLRAAGASGHVVGLKHNHADKTRLLDVLANMERYNWLEEQVFDVYVTFRESKDQGVLRTLDSIFEDPLLTSESRAFSFQARVSYNSAHMLKSRLNGDRYAVLQYMERIVNLWEVDVPRMKGRPYAYQRALINLLNGCYSSDQKERFEEVYRKAVEVKLKSKRDTAASMVSLLSVRLAFLFNNRFLNDMMSMQGEAMKVLTGYGRHANPSTVMNLWFNLGVSYFIVDEFQLAKRCFKHVADKKAYRKDLQGVARILLMLCEFDRDSDLYIRSLKDEAKRYYQKNRELSGLEDVVFGMVSRMLSKPLSKERDVLRNAREQIGQLGAEQLGAVGAEEVLYWIESRITKKPMKQVVMLRM